MTNYWIKLYHEILNDPKMALMPDNLWRRTIELFLLAGETGKGGQLPELEHISWLLRVPKSVLEGELKTLVEVGILSDIDGVYYVSKFTDRQASMSAAEHMRRKREKEKAGEYYDPPKDDKVSEFNRRNLPTEPVVDNNGIYEKSVSNTNKSLTKPVNNSNTDKIKIRQDKIKQEGKAGKKVDKIPEIDSKTSGVGGEPETDEFDLMREMLETVVGYPATPGDISAIDECVKMGIEEQDIRAALKWRFDNHLPPVKRLSQIVPGAMTNRNLRTQKKAAEKVFDPKNDKFAEFYANTDDDDPRVITETVSDNDDIELQGYKLKWELFESQVSPAVLNHITHLSFDGVVDDDIGVTRAIAVLVGNQADYDFVNSRLRSTMERHFMMPVVISIQDEIPTYQGEYDERE